MRLRCDYCGRFVELDDAKIETMGARADDPYLPDEKVVCPKCAKSDEHGGPHG